MAMTLQDQKASLKRVCLGIIALTLPRRVSRVRSR